MKTGAHGWMAYSNPAEVVPVNDIRPHDPGLECSCKPVIVEDVIVHNSHDGREQYERGERKYS